ncbi:hypothetical protein [Polyangium sp. y55x31]|uniref:hypothetical protein n=1 Tax=Polyangium sp. y55x31 TaxID=3042688 RepID=UPI002482AD24|nr:hypothetical protein [Polyangium sp. y55x31]MDI1476881.1 hypothetical protein [Polyangium sp. y55x31]
MKNDRLSPFAPSLLSIALGLALAACAAGVDPKGGPSSDGDGGSGDTGGTGGAGVGGTGGGNGGGGAGGGPSTPPELGAPLVFRETAPAVLVDTMNPAGAKCGVFPPIQGNSRRIVVNLADCDLGAATADVVGVIGSVTVRTTSLDDIDVRVEPSDAAISGAPHTVGPLVSATHGFVVMRGADGAFVVEVPGTASADVLVELGAFLVPKAAGGHYVHLLDQPVRFYAANPNDDGWKDPWPTLGTVHRYPVLGADQGATGMFGAVHLGPGVWRDAPVTFHMGPVQPAGAGNDLTRWASAPADSHFPWRYTSLFMVGAEGGEVELRSSSETEPGTESGIEPWIDAVGFLSPSAADGLVYRPLEKPLETPEPVITHNDEDQRFTTGLPEAVGVVGTLVFDLPPFETPQGYRWFHVMVGATADTFPGALGGGLEGPDWMTAELNQNGKVTTRFVTRTDAEGAFVMRHYAYTSGGASGVFGVPVTVRIEGALTKP